MKTKKLIPIAVLLLLSHQAIKAQSLRNKIQKSVVDIGETFEEIPMERLQHLDQVAFRMFKNVKDAQKVDVIFVDTDNQEMSQLAMIWLNTGMIYYGNSGMFNIRSAGVTPKIAPLSKLTTLEQYGFSIRNIRGEYPMSYKVDYGSGNWVVYPKPLQSPKSSTETNLEIYLDKSASNDTTNIRIELLFSDTKNIAREMLYTATRINNLLQEK